MTATNNSTQQLIDAFHRLHGNSIAERKKSFHTYLNALKTNTNRDAQKLSAVVDGIVPQDFWESVLKVDIILHCKLFTHALEVLKSEHKVLVSKLVKSDWFIKKLLETYTAQQFVDELFCFTSVSSRTKIINRVIKCKTDEEFGKQLFEAYTEKYGLRAAKLLLPLCSLDVIQDVVINKNITPSASTIRKVIGKDLKLTQHIFNNNSNYNLNSDDIKYIARTNLAFFTELLQRQHSNKIMGIGNSTTHKLITTYKSYIIENPKCLELDALKLKRIYIDLKDDYEQLVYKLIVARGHATRFDRFEKIFKPMPKQKQRAIFLSAFKAVAKCNLDEKPDYIDESFLQTCEDANERAKYAELAYNTDMKTHWIKYMRIDTAITLLKGKILFPSRPSKREEYVGVLVETCKINDDKVALLDILKYITKHFQNGRDSVRNYFCLTLLQHFKLYEFSKEHWKYINELQKLYDANRVYYFSDHFNYITQEEIIFCLKNNEPIGALLAQLCENSWLIEYNYCSDVGTTKKFILKSVAYYNSITEDVLDTKFSAYLRLLQAIQAYNSQNQTDYIDIRETLPIKWMVERLEKGCKLYLPCIDSLFTYCILGNAEPEEQNKATSVFFKKDRRDYNILLHIVKNKPDVLIDNIESFLESNALIQIFEDQKLLKYYRRLSHLNLNQTVVQYFKTNLFNTEDKYSNPQSKIKSLKALAVCMDEEDYLKLIEQYRPDNVDRKSDKSTELYQYREAICETILNVNTPSKALDKLFFDKDYLKLCLKGLYHFIFHTQERNIPRVLNELKSKAVSVRKHAAFLSLATLDRKHNLKFFENYTEQNPSVVAQVLKSTFKYFTKNFDKSVFEIFKVLLKKLDKTDENTLNFITKESVVPEIFVAEYVEFVWNTIESFGFDFEHTKFALLPHLKERDYSLLDDKFLDRIIKENFLKENKFLNVARIITDVVVRYLIYCNSVEKQNFRLQLVFEMLRDFKNADADKALDFSTAFIEAFCTLALEQKIPTIEFIEKLKQHFSAFTDVAESFIKHLVLDLLELHIKSLSSKNYVTAFGENIAYFLKGFEQNYGISLLMYSYSKNKILDVIKVRLTKLEMQLYEDNLYLFLDRLYATYDGLASAIIVTELLVKLDVDAAYDVQTRRRHNALIARLKSRDDPVVNVLLSSYFINRA